MKPSDFTVGQKVRVNTQACLGLFYKKTGEVREINDLDLGIYLDELEKVRYFAPDELEKI